MVNPHPTWTPVAAPLSDAPNSGEIPWEIEDDLSDADNRFPSIMAMAVALYFATSVFFSFREGYAWIAQGSAIAVGVIWLVVGVVIKSRSLCWATPVVLYVAWAAYGGTGIFASDFPQIFLGRYVTTLKVVAITWLAMQCVRSRTDLLTCMVAIGLANLVVFYLGYDDVVRTLTQGDSGRRLQNTDDVAGNANSIALISMLALIGGLSGFFSFKNKLVRFVSLLTIPGAIFLTLATGSRKGLFSMAFVGIGIYFLHLKRMGKGSISKHLIMFLFGAALAVGSVVIVINSPFLYRVTNKLDTAAGIQDEPRVRYFFMALQAVADRPMFGYGIGGFATSISGFHYSHSTISETLSCTGIPGFLLYWIGQVAFGFWLLRLRKAPLARIDTATVNMVLILFLVFVLYNIGSVMYYDRVGWPLLGAACGYLSNLERRQALRNQQYGLSAPLYPAPAFAPYS